MRRHPRDEAGPLHVERAPAAPAPAGPVAGVLSLQRTAGNRAVRAVLARESELDGAIRAANRQMRIHQERAAAAKAAKVRDEIMEYWRWNGERVFLESLKAVHESQRGVRLSYDKLPVTKTNPDTGASGKNNPWRKASKRQSFAGSGETGGSFCLGTSRGIAVRATFGVDKPSYFSVLTDLTKKAEAAKKAGAEDEEAKVVISRIVSHLHDPGSLEQFNQDLKPRYGLENVRFKAATADEAFAALKEGASVLADLEGGWHWVMVSRSPRGQLWKNDPLYSGGEGVQRISAGDLGSRFEIIVDATTGKPVTPAAAGSYEKQKAP